MSTQRKTIRGIQSELIQLAGTLVRGSFLPSDQPDDWTWCKTTPETDKRQMIEAAWRAHEWCKVLGVQARDMADALAAQATAETISMDRTAWEEAEYRRAENATDKGPFGCLCQNMAHHVLGDGCQECNSEMAAQVELESEEDGDHDEHSCYEPVHLKTCPFCGSVPTVERWHGGGPHKVRVGCDDPECTVRPASCDDDPWRAVGDWNCRFSGVSPGRVELTDRNEQGEDDG
jgi:hypothetical protein